MRMTESETEIYAGKKSKTNIQTSRQTKGGREINDVASMCHPLSIPATQQNQSTSCITSLLIGVLFPLFTAPCVIRRAVVLLGWMLITNQVVLDRLQIPPCCAAIASSDVRCVLTSNMAEVFRSLSLAVLKSWENTSLFIGVPEGPCVAKAPDDNYSRLAHTTVLLRKAKRIHA